MIFNAGQLEGRHKFDTEPLEQAMPGALSVFFCYGNDVIKYPRPVPEGEVGRIDIYHVSSHPDYTGKMDPIEVRL